MKLLFLTYYFPPEIGSGPHLPFELCESLVARGHEVAVVTGFPRYHVEVMPTRYRRHIFYKEAMSGIDVYRVNVPNTCTKQRYLRGVTQLVIPWLYALRAMTLEKPDLVFSITPPLEMGQAARLLSRRFRVPCVVNVQDLFPQSVIDLGMLHNRFLIRCFERTERKLYRKSDAITVMSDGNRDFVISKGGNPDSVQTIFNWVDTGLIKPGERANDFRKSHGLGDEFVALFAGTMGWSQGLDVVVDAAELLHDRKDIVFLIVGDGVEKSRIMQRAAHLPNIRFLPIQSKAVYPQVLAAGDAALVTLRPEVATPTVPSKISTIMSAGRPIIASIPSSGDVPKIIEKAKCGLVVPPADARALADAVLTLQNDSRKAVELGSNGRRFAEAFLSRDECIRQYEELFRDAIEKRGKTATSVSVKAFESPIVRAARSNDIEAIVDVHLSAFNAGFNLSAFGPRFLRKYYRLILEFEQRVLLVVECDGKIVGFAAGFVNPKGFYAKLKKNKWRLAFAAATAIPGRPSVVVRLLHVARRGSQFMARSETQQENTCELSSIAVRPEASGKGLGKALLNDFVEAAKSGRAREIYLTTDATENESVNAFYRRAGFILACEFMAPRNRQMNEFVLPLDRDACEA